MQPPVKWLTASEMESWLCVVRLLMWLPWSIDQQLRRDSKLRLVEYQVLAKLIGAQDLAVHTLTKHLRPTPKVDVAAIHGHIKKLDSTAFNAGIHCGHE